jgi:hypothetical protein
VMAWWDKGTTFDFSVFEKSSARMIGSFGLHSIDWELQKCELGYWLGKEFEGKGYASEAVSMGEKLALELGFHRILITCDGRNIRSQNVPIRSGYKLESIQIDEMKNRGYWRDTHQFVKLINPPIENRITEGLPVGFSILQTNVEKFNEIFGDLKEKIYEHEMNFWPRDVFSDEEKSKLAQMNSDYKNHYGLYLILYHGDELAGWSSGYQDSKESFHMTNSAILPEY